MLERGRSGPPSTPESGSGAAAALAERAQARARPRRTARCCAALLFTGAPGSARPLLLTVHHLVVDGVSWRILLEDLETAYRQAAPAAPVAPAAPEDHLVPRLGRAGWPRTPRPAGFDAELAHWTRGAARHCAAPLPADARRAPNTVAVGALGDRRGWTRSATAPCCSEVPGRLPHPGQRRAAAPRSAGCWPLDRRRPGASSTWRATAARRSSTASTCPAPSAGSPPIFPCWPGPSRRRRLRATRSSRSRSSCARCPRRGLGYGALRYLAGDASRLRPPRRPQVSFNYLGQFDSARRPATGSYRGCASRPGPRSDEPAAARPHLLDVVGRVGGGRAGAHLVLLAGHRTDEATVTRAGRGDAGRRCADDRRALRRAGRRRRAPRRTSRWPGSTRPRVDRLAGDGARGRGHLPADPDAGRHALPRAGRADARRLLRPGAPACWTAWPTPARSATAWQRVVDADPVLRTRLVWEGVADAAPGRPAATSPLPVTAPGLARPPTGGAGASCAGAARAGPGRGLRPGRRRR